MKNLISTVILITASIIISHAQIKKRAESFFGLHFDFHAAYEDDSIGKSLTKNMIEDMLIVAKPDYIQVDCKGHAGYSSYPTKVGNQTGGYIKDPLKLIREVTKKHEVAMYVHYSGILDKRAIELHPHWAKKDANGNPDKRETSRHCKYVDSLMLPQLLELANDYQVDGAWIDGECWGTNPDYSIAAAKDFLNETGYKSMPKTWDDEGYFELMEFTRKKFREHIAYYVNKIHHNKPGFQITSNWAYTGFMPEPVTIDIDFISGDLAAKSGVYSAAFESRCIAPQGKPWDLMGWSFSYDYKTKFRSQKSFEQICQESAHVLAMGGGFQLYFNQNRDASFQKWLFPLMGQISAFCNERKPYCFGNTQIPQIALLYSTESFKKDGKKIYSYSDGIADELKGTLMMLLDRQHCVEILMDHHLSQSLQKYPVIVVPGWKHIQKSIKQQLLNYAKSGGNLVVIGHEAIKGFEPELHCEIISHHPDEKIYLSYKNNMGMIFNGYSEVKRNNENTVVGGISQIQDFSGQIFPAASIQNYGIGKIATVFFNPGKSYIYQRISLSADFLSGIIHKIYPESLVKVLGTNLTHINITKSEDKTYLHLINTNGQHDNPNVANFNEINPIHNFQVEVKLSGKPKQIFMQPSGKKLNFEWIDDKAKIQIQQLNIYSIIEIEQ